MPKGRLPSPKSYKGILFRKIWVKIIIIFIFFFRITNQKLKSYDNCKVNLLLNVLLKQLKLAFNSTYHSLVRFSISTFVWYNISWYFLGYFFTLTLEARSKIANKVEDWGWSWRPQFKATGFVEDFKNVETAFLGSSKSAAKIL